MKDKHLTLRLPDALDRALGRAAAQREVPRSAVVREAVAEYLAPTTRASEAESTPVVRVSTVGDFLEHWILTGGREFVDDPIERRSPRTSRALGVAEARVHAQIWASLTARGNPIWAHDLIIGATAIANGHAVATLNRSDFARIPALRMIS